MHQISLRQTKPISKLLVYIHKYYVCYPATYIIDKKVAFLKLNVGNNPSMDER